MKAKDLAENAVLILITALVLSTIAWSFAYAINAEFEDRSERSARRETVSIPEPEEAREAREFEQTSAEPAGVRAETKTDLDRDAELLAKLLWGEARGIPSDTEKAAVVWCVLNRVDASFGEKSVEEVVTAPKQFHGYDPSNPVDEDLLALSKDVLWRWHTDSPGRVLPKEYVYFDGDGEHNYFRTDYMSGEAWDYELDTPYDS